VTQITQPWHNCWWWIKLTEITLHSYGTI